VTGQLVTTFENTPQQPFNRFTLKFPSSSNAALVTPPVCGTYTTRGALTPWSAEPGQAPLQVSWPLQLTQGVNGGPCPSSLPPFAPRVVVGTQNNAGGSYSPLYLRIDREDGEQELVKFSTIMPPGLSGNLSGVPLCSDTDIEAAKSVTGAQEEAQ